MCVCACIQIHMQKFSGSTCADRGKICVRKMFGKGNDKSHKGKNYTLLVEMSQE